VQARNKEALRGLLDDASSLYRGHMAAEVREHLDAYTGRWYVADIRVDTAKPHALPEI
jgi:hypothetical protein